MKLSTYRIIEFETKSEPRFIGVAWNYDECILISTKDYSSYTEAKQELESICKERKVELRWFDGHYQRFIGNDQLLALR